MVAAKRRAAERAEKARITVAEEGWGEERGQGATEGERDEVGVFQELSSGTAARHLGVSDMPRIAHPPDADHGAPTARLATQAAVSPGMETALVVRSRSLTFPAACRPHP